MTLFSYTARDYRGQRIDGVLESTDSAAVADQLARTGVTPITIVATATPAAVREKKFFWPGLSTPKVRPIDVQLFSRLLYTLLKANVPILRGLAGLQESAINKSFARVLKDLRESLDAGRELSVAMQRHPAVFSNFYVSMVQIGEMTGRLEEVFLRLFDHLEFDREMRERVSTALRYPIFVVAAMGIAIAVINLFVIPVFARVYSGMKADLPLMTKILIGFSDFTLQYWYLIALTLAGCAIAAKRYVATTAGRYQWDRFKLRIPIAGRIMLKATLARFSRSFALSSKSGVPIIQGLTVVANTVENAFISRRIHEMRTGVERGESILRSAIATGGFTPVVLQMISVGEETGELDDLMDEIAHMYEREVDYELKTLASQIEPILIIGLGIIVLVLALGVFLPIWDLGKISIKH